MSKYGLNIRVKPQQKQPAMAPVPKVLGFGDDDDDDNVERDILRQAYKNKTNRDVEEVHKKALEEDPTAFEYDGVYDEIKEKHVRPKEQERKDTTPKYIHGLIEKARQREREHEIIYERKLAKERSLDEHLHADKDKFVTSAYRKKLAEQAKFLEEDRLRDLHEQKEDVTKKADISDFYFNLSKNVAFGSGDAGKGKSRKHPDEVLVQPPRQVSPTTGMSSDPSRMAKRDVDDIAENCSPKENSGRPHREPSSGSSIQDQVTEDQAAHNLPRPDSRKSSEDVLSAAMDQQISDSQKGSENAVSSAKDHHKRTQDALAAAKERFLARKKAKAP